METEHVLEIRPGVFDIKVKEKDEIKAGDGISVKIEGVEYHDRGKERPKTIVLRVNAPSKYPIIRPERRNEDFHSWQGLTEHSDKISSKRVRRFFYKERGRDIVEIGDYQLIVLAFFGKNEAEKLHRQGYVCILRIVYPKSHLKRGE